MNLGKVSCMVLLIAGFSFQASAESTYGERLGWKAEDRVLIIHSDDAGMSYASNQGTIEALEYGLVTSTSIMMPCPWVCGFADYLKQHPETDAGLHLTMTSEYDFYRWMPVAGKPTVPGLADQFGCLWDNNQLTNEHATPDEIETEIRAQIDRAITIGIQPTHLDSHMGTLFQNPAYLERYIKVGIEMNIPVLMMGRLPVAEQVWASGLPVIDHLHTQSYDWRTTEKIPHYTEALRSLEPGITEMIIHCTKPDDVIPKINGGRDHLYGDYTALISPEICKVVKEEGIILTTWRELKQRRDQVGKTK
ncbi:MAG TPA: polysaccharide deacetylase family protein [bacterium]|nr:polysaccharide deacetylase family protein [bacterium]HQP99863.1 polysaccharide deacetylase family protein [bacterium]